MNTELESIDLNNNQLYTFPNSAVAGLNHVRVIWIDSNNLVALDVEGLKDSLPALYRIYLNDNLFACRRIAELLDKYEGSSLQLPPGFVPISPNRPYNMNIYFGFGCVDGQ